MSAPDLGYPVYDADNHLYEPEEALTSHLPKKYARELQYVEVRGRKKLAIGGVISPSLRVRVIADGLTIPWDLAVLPDGAVLFTERPGRLKVRLTNGVVRRVDADLSDLFARGETGLMGLTLVNVDNR